ncbi:MAG: M67 family metallopeptidase, partial [Thermoflexales bacterium]
LEAGYPNEACGLFIGEIDGADKRVVEAIPVANAWAPLEGDGAGHDLRDRFSIDPRDIVKADRDASKRGLDIIGFFHSHPDWPATPSETDRMWAWPVVSFMIVSVGQGRAGMARSWVLRDERDAFDEETLIVE